MGHLRDKAIVVTGAGRGIGAAIAEYCAQAGARVVVNDVDLSAARDIAVQITAAGNIAVACQADISQWKAAAKLMECCMDTFGSVDGLVNNAALFRIGRLDEMVEGDLNALLAVNIVGSANCAAHAAKQMIQQRRGSIVNITSGAQMGIPTMSAYGATKAAVAAFTYTWALELRDSNVRVNAVSPMASTAMGDATNTYLQTHGRPAVQLPKIAASVNAPVVAFLLSDASATTNGQIIRIEGNHLSIMIHPSVMLPILECGDGWTYETVSDAFEKDLVHRQVPVGVTGINVESFGPASKFWNKGD